MFVMSRSYTADLESGDIFSFCVYSGAYNIEAHKTYDQLKTLGDAETPVDISNSNGQQMLIKKVELVVKERDLEYEIEFCDIFVTGVIL